MKARKNHGVLLFAVLFAMPVLIFWLHLIFFGQTEISETENRTLAMMPTLTGQAFVTGAYQDDLEDALGDQTPQSEAIRSFVKDREAETQKTMQNLLFSVFPQLKDGYVRIADGYYMYHGDEHRIVEKPMPPQKTELMESVGAGLKQLSVPTYLYFVENSRSQDLDRVTDASEHYLQMVETLEPDDSDNFRFSDYDEYCALFYETDHHWNAEGSYQGYRQILRMLKPEDEPLEKGELCRTDVVFNGSYARFTKNLCATEKFTFYDYDVPKHAETLNGKRGTYGRMSAYKKGKVAEDELTNHYAACYGGDYGEIIYDFGTQGKGNLLMIASSYSNPINALIASHFDRTYVIDLRYYEEWAGQAFDPVSYAVEHPVDRVLLLGDARLFASDEGE